MLFYRDPRILYVNMACKLSVWKEKMDTRLNCRVGKGPPHPKRSDPEGDTKKPTPSLTWIGIALAETAITVAIIILVVVSVIVRARVREIVIRLRCVRRPALRLQELGRLLISGFEKPYGSGLPKVGNSKPKIYPEP